MTTADRMKLLFATALFRAKDLLTGGRTMTPIQPSAAGRLYDFTVKTIAGQDKSLGDYKGRAVLIVNTASLCGFTPQYEALEALHKKFNERGLSVLGFPANDFGAQEPGTDAEIQQFCRTRYSIGFDLFSKITVKGGDIHPLYKYLTTESGFAGDIDWNFSKFLVDRQGRVVGRFGPADDPLSSKVQQQVERALASR